MLYLSPLCLSKAVKEIRAMESQAVADNLRNQLGLLATTEHVKNRIKVWKKHHSVITDIRTYTKFKWDDDKKMLIIPIEDHEECSAYCKVNAVASAYRNKNIDYWDEICTYLPWIELWVKKLSNMKNLWQLWRKKMKLAVLLRQTLHHLTRGQRKILSWMLFLDLQSHLKTIYNQTNFHLSLIPKRFMMLFQRLPDKIEMKS
ncbi:uncharacterized protein LOC130815195 [Amaranthus tricolor]|uniref:uncharacterized protein LOC130815195 n=1 Tax=Amaranthus tricolor TaxID=29722 RepID=UPI00258D7CA1|nr:uncharacterized protein LOC130815195 [Amaranthus tricolor]